MKRSEINARIRGAEAFFYEQGFRLPPWSERAPRDWKAGTVAESEIIENMLGWDLTDFGSGVFAKRGLLLFTLRNGNQARDRKTYAEKVMVVEEGQETPMHFHWSKMEDIIVRGGGKLVVELYRSTPSEGLSMEGLRVRVDGIERELPAGGQLRLGPGESICLDQGLYHRFWGEGGRVLVGEVSMVNDDTKDNRFLEPGGRFPEVEEDEEPYRLLVSDYAGWLA